MGDSPVRATVHHTTLQTARPRLSRSVLQGQIEHRDFWAVDVETGARAAG